ncbi:MAG: bifunctional DNA-formamidopyrimidine glycosylase/DNA-(apurinic or apyrimidinic site) lyase [Magnetococcales bacterium]|nr:bifunctional DNA-formamidopyrimidine glycosylase/DNA-(apurinic or apyrimidinic site) lyase [Magnetococcales bacterium]
MPELPEVETIRTGLAPCLIGRQIQALEIRTPKLRWPIPEETLRRHTLHQTIRTLERRGKYLLAACGPGHMLIHLGMSGRLFLLPPDACAERHDHVIWTLDDRTRFCLHDPRRFGALLWIEGEWQGHPLLQELGPEPLEEAFDGDHLYVWSRNRRVAIKTLLMNGRVVVGVGNIYATEALFLAGVHPARPAHWLTRACCGALAEAIRQVLRAAIRQGGTTLRDYRQSDGRPGYFALELQAYGRTGAPCHRCATPIASLRLGQRSAFFCPRCQPLEESN